MRLDYCFSIGFILDLLNVVRHITGQNEKPRLAIEPNNNRVKKSYLVGHDKMLSTHKQRPKLISRLMLISLPVLTG